VTTLFDPLCHRPAATWNPEIPDEPEHYVDRFATSWMETFRRGIAQESREALALLYKSGLKAPCARQTT
jgi:hypothetical protein